MNGVIYFLAHPQTEEIRYIGQTRHGIKHRLKGHVNCSVNLKSNESKTPVGKWIKKLHDSGLEPKTGILQEVPVEQLDVAEIKWIAFGRKQYRLLNLSDGGRIDGRKKGSKQTPEFCVQNGLRITGVKNHNFKNLVGQKFNKLTVIKLDGFRKFNSWWECKCECGGTKIVRSSKLGRTLSCGCAQRTKILTEKQLEALRVYGTPHRYKIHANPISTM